MKEILLFILEGYADWETGYTSAKLNKAELGYQCRTISTDNSPLTSSGNFSTNVDYELDSYQGFDNLAALLLIGGTGWGDEGLIRGYNLERYDKKTSGIINVLVKTCLTKNILVAGICDGATFLADNDHLNSINHTGNTLAYLKEKCPNYSGDSYFLEQQAVCGGNIITANGTAVLEFTREIVIKLNMLESKEKAQEWYEFFKKGYYPAF